MLMPFLICFALLCLLCSSSLVARGGWYYEKINWLILIKVYGATECYWSQTNNWRWRGRGSINYQCSLLIIRLDLKLIFGGTPPKFIPTRHFQINSLEVHQLASPFQLVVVSPAVLLCKKNKKITHCTPFSQLFFSLQNNTNNNTIIYTTQSHIIIKIIHDVEHSSPSVDR